MRPLIVNLDPGEAASSFNRVTTVPLTGIEQSLDIGACSHRITHTDIGNWRELARSSLVLMHVSLAERNDSKKWRVVANVGIQ